MRYIKRLIFYPALLVMVKVPDVEAKFTFYESLEILINTNLLKKRETLTMLSTVSHKLDFDLQ